MSTATATIIRFFHTISKINGMAIHQMDVNSAFLIGELIDETFVTPPEPFNTRGKWENAEQNGHY